MEIKINLKVKYKKTSNKLMIQIQSVVKIVILKIVLVKQQYENKIKIIIKYLNINITNLYFIFFIDFNKYILNIFFLSIKKTLYKLIYFLYKKWKI